MKKQISVFRVLAIFIVLMLILGNSVLANQTINTNITIGGTTAIRSSEGMTRRLLGIVQAIGSVISVLALVIIGIRYMFSSLEERAQMKGVLIYYVIGAILVFATSSLLGAVYKAIWGLDMDKQYQNSSNTSTHTPPLTPQHPQKELKQDRLE